jgi:hypothetical protein
MWKNTVQRVRPQITIRRMRVAFWIPKATNTLSEYVILIAFPLHQRLHERLSLLRYTYSGWLDSWLISITLFYVILADLLTRYWFVTITHLSPDTARFSLRCTPYSSPNRALCTYSPHSPGRQHQHLPSSAWWDNQRLTSWKFSEISLSSRGRKTSKT